MIELGEARVVGAGPLVGAIAREIGLVEIVDRNVAWDPVRSKLSPGELILALVLNLLTSRQPLYKVWLDFHETDIELLLGEGIELEDVNDDALGRALDKFQAGGARRIFSMVAAQALAQEEVERRFLHWDSTSKSLYGEYSTATGEGAAKPAYGYSKDHRPDLKQIIMTLFCNREGIPLVGEVRDGNSSDKKLNNEMIGQLVEMFSPGELRELVYVADSALVTDDNLKALSAAEVRFLSRLPETYRAAAEAKALAWEGEWTTIGRISPQKGAAEYLASEQRGVVAGRDYRLVIYRSSHLDKRKAKSLERELVAERERLGKEAAVLANQRFFCREDAEAAGQAWLKENSAGFHSLSLTVSETREQRKRARRGRPRRDEDPEWEAFYQLQVEIGPRLEERVQAEQERRSAFVLITDLAPEEFPADRLLLEYKAQTSVEQRFRFLKDPSFVDAFYLQKPERVEALGYVMMLAALVFSLLERRIRRSEQPLVTPARGPLKNPTGREILQNIKSAMVTVTGRLERRLSIPRYFRSPLQAVLTMAGFDERIYTEVPVRRFG